MMEPDGLTGDETASGTFVPGVVDATPSPERLTSEAVARLYDLHASEMLAFLQGVLREPEGAREALQNTFQRLLEVGHTARPDSVRGWLFRVAFHEAMALRRRQSAQNRTWQRLTGRISLSEGESLPEVKLIHAEDVAELKRALEDLPPDQRLVVERRIYREETFAHIAADLKVPLGTVLTRMRLALQKLRIALGRSASKDQS